MKNTQFLLRMFRLSNKKSKKRAKIRNRYNQALHLTQAPGRRQSKTLIVSTNVDPKSLETEFVIAIFVARLATNGNRKHRF